MRRILVFLALLMSVALCGCGLLPQSRATLSAVISPETPAVTAALTPPNPSRQEILDAFREIAFTGEYGTASNQIRKWTEPVKVAVNGNPTVEDLAALKRAMDGLNSVEGFPGISLDDAGHNMDIWFVPLGSMANSVPDYVAGNWGFFSTDFDGSGITSSTVAIAEDVTSQKERNHLIFEEVLQSTGLMQDSSKYSDSIFYSKWTTVQQPTKLDWVLLGMLYIPEIRQGMTPDEAMAVLEDNAALQSTSGSSQAASPEPYAEPTPWPSPSPADTGVLPAGDYAYFKRVGFGVLSDGSPAIAKWTEPIKIQVTGNPGSGDRRALNNLIIALGNIDGIPDITFVTEGGNVNIGFVAKDSGKNIDSQYNGIDYAQAFIKLGEGTGTSSVHIIITNELIGQKSRDASLAGFIFQGLGLAADPQNEYADSVLCKSAMAAEPSKLDWLMLSLLYSPEVKPGMKLDMAMPVIMKLDPTSFANSSNGKEESLSYFNEVGFYWTENGRDGVAGKWAAPIKLQVSGSPTAEQQEMLNDYTADLNKIKGFPGIEVVQSVGNFTIKYAVRKELLKSFPKMVATEACNYSLSRSKVGTITGCYMGVATDFKDGGGARSQFLRLLIWSMGINFTSDTYPDSILNTASGIQDWSGMDWMMVDLLYRSDIKPGEKRADVMAMLGKIQK